MTSRHDRIRDLIKQHARMAGCMVESEPSNLGNDADDEAKHQVSSDGHQRNGPYNRTDIRRSDNRRSDMRRPDLLIHIGTIRYLLDVAVIHPTVFSHLQRGNGRPADAIAAKEQEKTRIV